MNFRNGLKAAFFLLLIAGAAAYAASPFDSDQEAYDFGYKEGHNHGIADREAGLDFDYRHGHRFRSGITFHSYVDNHFQTGYIDGYTDGYDSRAGRVERRMSPSGSFYRSTPNDLGFVTAFTKSKFDGYSRSFEIGEYRELEDAWDDTIDSIRISGPVRVILFDEEDFRGARLIIERDTHDLGDLNFDSRAESMIVEVIR